MGDPAEENDPPPESRRLLSNRLQTVNWKKPKKVQSRTWTARGRLCCVLSARSPWFNGLKPAFVENPSDRKGHLAWQGLPDKRGKPCFANNSRHQ